MQARAEIDQTIEPDDAVADGAPERLVAVHRAILGVHVLDARGGQFAVAIGEGCFAGLGGVIGVPAQSDVVFLDALEELARLDAAPNVAAAYSRNRSNPSRVVAQMLPSRSSKRFDTLLPESPSG